MPYRETPEVDAHWHRRYDALKKKWRGKWWNFLKSLTLGVAAAIVVLSTSLGFEKILDQVGKDDTSWMSFYQRAAARGDNLQHKLTECENKVDTLTPLYNWKEVIPESERDGGSCYTWCPSER